MMTSLGSLPLMFCSFFSSVFFSSFSFCSSLAFSIRTSSSYLFSLSSSCDLLFLSLRLVFRHVQLSSQSYYHALQFLCPVVRLSAPLFLPQSVAPARMAACFIEATETTFTIFVAVIASSVCFS